MHPSMAKLPSQEAAALAYAEVYSLVGWLHAQIGYNGIRELLVAQKDGKSARRAVAEALNRPWGSIDKDWRAHLKVSADAKARAGKPIKFGNGGVDSENVGLDKVNPRARKFARIAGMLRARGMLEPATVEYEKALQVAPDPFVAGKLARTLVELGRHERAIELATPLVTADDQDAVAAVTLGIARAARHEWAGAVGAYEQALRVSPFDPQVRCGLAEAYAQIGNTRAARERRACDELKN